MGQGIQKGQERSNELSENGSDDSLEMSLKLARAERYILQSVARQALPDQRVRYCLRHRRSKDIDIEVWKHLKTRKAFYAGLQVCGSVWNCPPCAAKISERRRCELKKAVDLHKESGGGVVMMTLTFSHHRNDKLIGILDDFLKSIRKFRSGRPYTKIMEQLEVVGTIRTFEITWGRNGWHPHVHILVFYRNSVVFPMLEFQLFILWQRACSANGLLTKERYGLTIQDGGQADDYITKWGVDQEMTKSHIKKGRDDSLTPFDFLRKYIETEDKKFLNLFSEYAAALKGKSQLFWSRGLKAKFGIDEKSDEQLAEEKTEMADLLGILRYYEWQRVMYSENRVRFLELCEQSSFEEAVQLVVKRRDIVDKENKKHPSSWDA